MKTIICLNCQTSKEVEDRFAARTKYCSIKCQHDHSYKEKIKLWFEKGIVPYKKQIKKFLIREYGEKCGTCNITEWQGKPIVFELEHKDGNSENNSLNNLQLICPNCHSQTGTYKGANRGNGRHSRRMRYHEGKSY